MEEPLKDSDLIKQAQEGKQKAFTQLFNKYEPFMFNTIYQMVKNRDVADDLVLVAFTKAFQRIDSYVKDISFIMWLKTIATNTTIDFIRRSKDEKNNHYLDDEDNYIQLESTDYNTPESNISLKETAAQIEDAIDRLKYRQQTVLRLKLDGKSYKEIADQMNLKEDVVKSTLNKARQRLKKLLNEQI